MSSVPNRSIIGAFSKAKPAKTSFGSNIQSLTHKHQQSLKNDQKQTQKNINLMGENKQRIDRAIPTSKQPVKSGLQQVSHRIGNRMNNLKAKVNGEHNK
jgi:hypothetical protein